MQRPYKFKDKKYYDRVVKFFGEPPCSICAARTMGCIKESFNEINGFYEIFLRDACDEAREWFSYGQSLGFAFDWNKKKGFWESHDRDALKDRIKRIHSSFGNPFKID